MGDIPDLGGGGDEATPDTGADTPEPAADTPATEQPDDLLAEPAAKRDDKEYVRGPYKRHQSSYNKGRRIKNYKSLATPETGTARTTFPGKTGFGGLDSIARGMVETKERIDRLDEQKLFTTNAEVSSLLEGLFKKEKQDETQ